MKPKSDTGQGFAQASSKLAAKGSSNPAAFIGGKKSGKKGLPPQLVAYLAKNKQTMSIANFHKTKGKK